MNFNPEFTVTTAIIAVLFSSFLWNTWSISLKHIGDYPLDGFYIILFVTSIILVWGFGVIVEGPALFQNIRKVYEIDSSRVLVTLICGAGYVFGMRLSLFVMKTIGLSLTQPIASSFNIFVGTITAALIGGVPEGFSILKMLFACLFLFSAVGLSVYTGRLRSDAQAIAVEKNKLQYTVKDVWKSVGLILISSSFIQAYTFGISYGLSSVTQDAGLEVLPFLSMLVTGAFIGTIIGSGIMLTKRKQWGIVLKTPFSISKFGIMSGLFHYGGNIIHTFATAYLSSAISWPLGITGGFWPQFWGLVYGEYKGSPPKVYISLAVTFSLYVIGAIIIGSMVI